jgi:hypothetical protein
MVNKRMERPAKLRLVSQLGLVQLAVQLGYAVDDDDDVVSAVAALLAALMHELVGTLLARADAKEPGAHSFLLLSRLIIRLTSMLEPREVQQHCTSVYESHS